MAVIEDLRRMINEPEPGSNYSDIQLEQILSEAGGILASAAARIWTEKAAVFTALVDMQEGESRRDLSDLMKNALAMAETYRSQATAESPVVGNRATTIGRISRA